MQWLIGAVQAVACHHTAPRRGGNEGNILERVERLEQFCFTMRNALSEEKPKDKFEDPDTVDYCMMRNALNEE